MTEVERKFLVRGLPPVSPAGERVEQGYLSTAADELEVRVRRKGRARVLTLKGRGDLSRIEIEKDVTEAEFAELWPLTEHARVEKTRYTLPHDGHVIELDVYDGALRGLVVAEVEFASADDAAAFRPPSWFGDEVTRDGRYKNRRLALDGLPKKA